MLRSDQAPIPATSSSELAAWHCRRDMGMRSLAPRRRAKMCANISRAAKGNRTVDGGTEGQRRHQPVPVVTGGRSPLCPHLISATDRVQERGHSGSPTYPAGSVSSCVGFNHVVGSDWRFPTVNATKLSKRPAVKAWLGLRIGHHMFQLCVEPLLNRRCSQP
jgi:hypothetical protein